MIAVTQARGIGPGKTYVGKLITGGKTRTEAMRLLHRRLSDVAFRALLTDEQATTHHTDISAQENLPQVA